MQEAQGTTQLGNAALNCSLGGPGTRQPRITGVSGEMSPGLPLLWATPDFSHLSVNTSSGLESFSRQEREHRDLPGPT